MFRNFGLGAERIMGMDAATWARHANPWSGWSRVSILPLFAVAVWSRVWIDWWALLPTGLVFLWAWLNPCLFSPPASTDNWMSKGVMGERIWLMRGEDPVLAHHASTIRVLMLLTLAGSILLLAGLILLNLPLVMTGLAVAILSKLWFLDRMVWIYTEIEEERDLTRTD